MHVLLSYILCTVILSNLAHCIAAYLLFTEINLTFSGYRTRSDRRPGI